jgi:3-keto-5-aminohexanoate cleavage enzyme
MIPVIITAAICGAETTREDNPALPLTAAELAQAAKKCQDAGASVIHLHVRDQSGAPTQDREVFRAAIEAMQEAGVTAIVQPSTGGAAGMSWDERLQPLDLDPEMASLDCGTVNFGDTVFVNDLPGMRHAAAAMRDRGIAPELECFEPGHINNAMILHKEGLLNMHLHFGVVLGVPGAMPAGVKGLLFMVDHLPEGCTWTVAAMGRHQLPMAIHALAMGGNVRVGFEDNVYYSKGVPAASNAQLVLRITRIAAELGRPVATPDQAREILDITAS